MSNKRNEKHKKMKNQFQNGYSPLSKSIKVGFKKRYNKSY